MEYQLCKMVVLKGLKARMTKMSIIRTQDDLLEVFQHLKTETISCSTGGTGRDVEGQLFST